MVHDATNAENPAVFLPQQWRDAEGDPVTCTEKQAELAALWHEARQVCQDALDDTLLMAIDEAQARGVLAQMLSTLQPTVRPRKD